jgi:hypothetical protein
VGVKVIVSSMLFPTVFVSPLYPSGYRMLVILSEPVPLLFIRTVFFGLSPIYTSSKFKFPVIAMILVNTLKL